MKGITQGLFGLALWALMGTAWAGEPPDDPVLRIDPGAHTAPIRRISSDAAGRWLVTASDDKTARVWDLGAAEPRLLAILRPPLGPGNEGKLYSVAMSPDGGVVAVGGWTGWDFEQKTSIYLFDRASGRMLRRLPNLPEVINHMDFSPDGRHLAAVLGGAHGLRLFDTETGQILSEDRGYGTDSYSVKFSPDGQRLVTTSWDGKLRLYRWVGDQLSLLTQKAAPGGKQPYAARFSPDGRLIVVGFHDASPLNVLDGQTLALLATPDTRGVDANLGYAITWSADGRWLMAAGMAQDKNTQRYIRRWPIQGGKFGAPQDWPVSRDTVLDMTLLPEGRVVFGSADPAWGLVEGKGKFRLFQSPAVADLRDAGDTFQLSADGGQVRFGYETFGKSPALFDLSSRAFLPVNTPGLQGPRGSAPGMKLTDWKNTTAPKLNGQTLAMKPYETARSIAVRPDGRGFVLGTEWSLRSFDAKGQMLWEKPVPGNAWSVNIPQDGRWVVAACGDGTIRWYRLQDGTEQLALYPHPDRRRWVLWSPSGYFDASPGADDLIGWHLNRGKEQSGDFFPASRFRERFYRPDVLANLLESGDEAKALQLADAQSNRRTQNTTITQLLPPVARILSPTDGDRFDRANVTLRYSARTPNDAPVTGVKVLVDGRPLSQERGLQRVEAGIGADGKEYNVALALPARDLELSLIAENKNGASEASKVRLTWVGNKAQEFVPKPKLYVLSVGVSKYQRSELDLGLASKDAGDFATALKGQEGKLYDKVEVRLLTDTDATKDGVLDGLEWLRSQVTSRDLGIVFLAGHGENDNTNNYYFLPHNADPSKLLRTGVAQHDIRTTLQSLAGKALFFVDTCHAGNALGTSLRRGGTDINGFVSELASAENGVVVFTASTGRQFSLEDPSWGNGAFTKAVVEGISGKADFQKSGKITHKGLDYYVTERVKELTGGRQSPVSITPAGITDFPIAVVE